MTCWNLYSLQKTQVNVMRQTENASAYFTTDKKAPDDANDHSLWKRNHSIRLLDSAWIQGSSSCPEGFASFTKKARKTPLHPVRVLLFFDKYCHPVKFSSIGQNVLHQNHGSGIMKALDFRMHTSGSRALIDAGMRKPKSVPIVAFLKFAVSLAEHIIRHKFSFLICRILNALNTSLSWFERIF